MKRMHENQFTYNDIAFTNFHKGLDMMDAIVKPLSEYDACFDGNVKAREQSFIDDVEDAIYRDNGGIIEFRACETINGYSQTIWFNYKFSDKDNKYIVTFD